MEKIKKINKELEKLGYAGYNAENEFLSDIEYGIDEFINNIDVILNEQLGGIDSNKKNELKFKAFQLIEDKLNSAKI